MFVFTYCKIIKPVSLCDCNWTRTQHHLVLKRTLNHLASLEFIQFLPGSLTFDSDMYSCDIESLYTSVPTELGLESIEYWIMRKQGLIPQRFTKNLF